MLPQTSEQKGVATRVSQLGAGIKLNKATPKALLSATNEILSNKTYKENQIRSDRNASMASGKHRHNHCLCGTDCSAYSNHHQPDKQQTQG